MAIVMAVLVIGAVIGYVTATIRVMRFVFPPKETEEASVQTDAEELPDCELYVTQYGQRYHRSRSCGGLSSARKFSSVTPCRVCMR